MAGQVVGGEFCVCTLFEDAEQRMVVTSVSRLWRYNSITGRYDIQCNRSCAKKFMRDSKSTTIRMETGEETLTRVEILAICDTIEDGEKYMKGRRNVERRSKRVIKKKLSGYTPNVRRGNTIARESHEKSTKICNKIATKRRKDMKTAQKKLAEMKEYVTARKNDDILSSLIAIKDESKKSEKPFHCTKRTVNTSSPVERPTDAASDERERTAGTSGSVVSISSVIPNVEAELVENMNDCAYRRKEVDSAGKDSNELGFNAELETVEVERLETLTESDGERMYRNDVTMDVVWEENLPVLNCKDFAIDDDEMDISQTDGTEEETVEIIEIVEYVDEDDEIHDVSPMTATSIEKPTIENNTNDTERTERKSLTMQFEENPICADTREIFPEMLLQTHDKIAVLTDETSSVSENVVDDRVQWETFVGNSNDERDGSVEGANEDILTSESMSSMPRRQNARGTSKERTEGSWISKVEDIHCRLIKERCTETPTEQGKVEIVAKKYSVRMLSKAESKKCQQSVVPAEISTTPASKVDIKNVMTPRARSTACKYRRKIEMKTNSSGHSSGKINEDVIESNEGEQPDMVNVVNVIRSEFQKFGRKFEKTLKTLREDVDANERRLRAVQNAENANDEPLNDPLEEADEDGYVMIRTTRLNGDQYVKASISDTIGRRIGFLLKAKWPGPEFRTKCVGERIGNPHDRVGDEEIEELRRICIEMQHGHTVKNGDGAWLTFEKFKEIMERKFSNCRYYNKPGVKALKRAKRNVPPTAKTSGRKRTERSSPEDIDSFNDEESNDEPENDENGKWINANDAKAKITEPTTAKTIRGHATIENQTTVDGQSETVVMIHSIPKDVYSFGGGESSDDQDSKT